MTKGAIPGEGASIVCVCGGGDCIHVVADLGNGWSTRPVTVRSVVVDPTKNTQSYVDAFHVHCRCIKSLNTKQN